MCDHIQRNTRSAVMMSRWYEKRMTEAKNK